MRKVDECKELMESICKESKYKDKLFNILNDIFNTNLNHPCIIVVLNNKFTELLMNIEVSLLLKYQKRISLMLFNIFN